MADDMVFCALTGRRVLANGAAAEALTIKSALYDGRTIDEICNEGAAAELAALQRVDGIQRRRADASEIVFCAKTGHRLVADNVIAFPRRGAKSVPIQAEHVPEHDDI
ncbi:hypothetical protein [Mesorhizobium sp. M4B.F.Ca.ET.013.02.1.1]|uniref:hypothetical protein n=1 Tax=Mesorhizobium sp. M4B.F.Ca.ET.013.02.1.1 TaxID=2496755 RepID=UPI000FD59BF2|nr:hypothetical protein [Mesorhizobium sp. M4B.F.Ca.ET.013.02.1.1]RUW24665.1 hypothetical protein EOA34_14300 [Mesorhizobium sp. M4B.F.Ca.ET.013.02.1.1]